MISEVVLFIFGESELKQFFSMLTDNFPGGEIVFNALSKLGIDFRAWIDTLTQEQQNAMQTAL